MQVLTGHGVSIHYLFSCLNFPLVFAAYSEARIGYQRKDYSCQERLFVHLMQRYALSSMKVEINLYLWYTVMCLLAGGGVGIMSAISYTKW